MKNLNNNVLNFSQFIKEQLETNPEELNPPIVDKFSGIKKYLVKLIVTDTDISNAEKQLIQFLAKIEDEGSNDIAITGLTEDADYYELFLTYRVEIDEKLNTLDFFEKVPSDSSIFSLYDYVINGVKTAVISLLSDVKKQLQG